MVSQTKSRKNPPKSFYRSCMREQALAMTQCCADAKDYVPKTCGDNTEVAAAYVI